MIIGEPPDMSINLTINLLVDNIKNIGSLFLVTVLVTMKKMELRTIIKFLNLNSLKSVDFFAEMQSRLGESAPPYATVKNWRADFKMSTVLDAQEMLPQQNSRFGVDRNGMK